jgi:hypothetical protein
MVLAIVGFVGVVVGIVVGHYFGQNSSMAAALTSVEAKVGAVEAKVLADLKLIKTKVGL